MKFFIPLQNATASTHSILHSWFEWLHQFTQHCYLCLNKAILFNSNWGQSHWDIFKCQECNTQRQSAISQNPWIFSTTTVRTSNVTHYWHSIMWGMILWCAVDVATYTGALYSESCLKVSVVCNLQDVLSCIHFGIIKNTTTVTSGP
jgi:hypothetical protein